MSFLLSILLLLVPAPVKTEHGRFNIVKDGQKIGTDEFSIGRHDSNYVLESKTIIGDVTISSRMEVTEKLAPVSYEASSVGGSMRVTIIEDPDALCYRRSAATVNGPKDAQLP